MKKLITILAITMCLTSKSQLVNGNGTLTLYSIIPNSACECDSVYLSLRWKMGGPWSSMDSLPQSLYHLYLRVLDPNLGNNIFIHVRSYHPWHFLSFDKLPAIVDTIYSYWQRVPCEDFVDKYKLSASSTIVLAEYTLFNANANPAKPVFINKCEHVGIEEYELNGEKCIYYDLFGNVIEPEKNRLMIRQVGRTRQKVIIQD